MEPEGPARAAYAAAGVDVAAGDRAVELMRGRIAAAGAGGADLLGGLGGFGAALELPPGMRRPVLVSATDGVGTKTEIARALGRFDTIGRDLVAMCADDVVCHGARPWLFLDYVAVGRVEPERVAQLVGGIAEGCATAGAMLVGGETAEHPGVMEPDAFDLAGFCVGIVERDELIDGSATRAGDAIIGIASSGLHANGYSLVRATLRETGTALDEPLEAAPGGAATTLGATTVGEALLEPTTIHAPDVLAVRDELAARGLRLGGIAHITGGGLPSNLPRALTPDLGAVVYPDRWPIPPVMALIARRAEMSGPELRATFNGGIGMALVVEPAATSVVLELLASRGQASWVIGQVVPVGVTGPSRYREEAG
ncbi:MAG: phosphoribosylformylglycinamidine cyclo-ligase [Chloroflexi bacterium]|nr:phosphoribosylformylglycinamidine cyclo-ligase [Chloroflexota bacterium]